MGKNINLNSGEWCEIVFEDKNKAYGAYRLRQSSSKRHIAAFLVMLLFSIAVAVIPPLVGFISEQLRSEQLGAIDETFALTDLSVDEPEIPQENIIEKAVVPPPPPLKSTVRFTPPVIVEDDQIEDADKMRSQDDLAENKVTISLHDVKGDDDKKGIDLADLKDHKVIVEKKVDDDKPFITVEQMPSFPGGEKAMLQFISSNLKYPVVAQETGIQGRVIIRFVVTRTGDISDVRVVRGLDPSCDREAVRVVKSMPKWIPGRQNGQPVPVYFNLPILFRLQN